jgi:cold shock CspA family protein/ribosome-associated translation inhibitor RaiA
MELPIQISARNVTLAPGDEAAIRRAAGKLEKFYDRITGCRVLVEAENRYPSGRDVAYRVRIDLTIPGTELVVTRQPHADLLTAVQEAFDAAQRRVEDYARLQRGDTKRPAGRQKGRVTKLFPFEGYGFLETDDGLEVYFHRNSVLKEGFDRLEMGSRVRFVEEPGERGPQASTVALIGPRRRRVPAS